jgi:hypothetical protein
MTFATFAHPSVRDALGAASCSWGSQFGTGNARTFRERITEM